MDAAFAEECEMVTVGRHGEHYKIPQRKYEGLPDDPTEQWLAYNERMAMQDKIRDAERAERKRQLAEERAKAEEAAKRRAEEEAKKPKQPQEETGTLAWFARRMQGQVTNTFDNMRVNATAEQLPQYLKIAIQQLVAASGETFQDDDFINKYIALVARWMLERPKMGLILRGNVGVGKTTIAKAIASVYTICNGRGFKVYDAMELTRMARDDEKGFHELCDYPMLGIDDLGTEAAVVKNYGNDITPMVELLMHRHAKRMFTVITTNLSYTPEGEDEINKRYGKRISDRLQQLCSTIKFDGSQKSYRQ